MPCQFATPRGAAPRRRPRRCGPGLALAALAVAAALPGRAADPVAYTVAIAPTGDAALDQAARESSTLLGLRESAPVGPFALIGRARADLARLQTALDSFGYYKGRVAITVAGERLDDPGLADALDAAPPGSAVTVAAVLTPGPLFHLRRLTLPPEVPAVAKAALGLSPGDPARAADVLAARARIRAALLNAGHALARVGDPVATPVPEEDALDVTFPVEAGPRLALGPIRIAGAERLEEDYLRRRLRLAPGETFNPAAIEAARQDLAAVPAIASVRILPAEAPDAAGTLPVQVDITERKLRAVSVTAAWSTDQGGSLGADWTHRDLFGRAEVLALAAAVTQIGGTAAQQPGYNATAALTFPDIWQRGQSLAVNLQAVREYPDAYDRTAAIAGAALARRLTGELTVSGGLQVEQSYIVQDELGRSYSLLQAPLGAHYDSAHDLFDPTHGIRANVTVTPTYSLAGSGGPSDAFVIAQAGASTYLDLGAWLAGREGRSILALRALVGAVNGTASAFDIPPDQRFYAGGGGTIRGFRYQSVGPKFANGKPTGGNAIDVASLEFRQRFGETWGAAAFVDAGQLGTTGVPFAGAAAVGAGVGLRYYTSIGPIRADVAVPLTHETRSDAVEAYIGIGQAF